ncbi:MAG: tripartite tricarboxylate transporter substrate binding protein [Burkholderiaceae bacterium]|nr:tripartite tricarboxylate transporter substrate binding protein [Burkholderiaceae bacterium]MDO9090598.1 tripartite tricarboxylate transporter substrate binding protein [Burkholderiaceae bacterium]
MKSQNRPPLSRRAASAAIGLLAVSGTGALRGLAASLLTAGIVSSPAHAQQFPSKPIHIIVPLGAGSSTDIVARLVAQGITEETGLSVLVENRTGAEGAIGAKAVATSPPDGYTLLLSTSSTQVVNVHLYKNLPYDPIKDFVPVAPLLALPLQLYVNTASSLNSVADVIKRAKEGKGLTFGSSTATMRLSGEMFKQKSGAPMTNVPYRATAAALVDLAGGRIDAVFTDGASAAGQMQAGKIKPLAVMADRRAGSMPNLPTIAEAGVVGYSLTVFFGVWAPANTPPAVVNRLNTLFMNAMKTPRVRELMSKISADPLQMTPDEFRKLQIAEIEKIAPVVSAAGIERQ